MDNMFKTYTLANGITLIYQQMPAKSVSVGLWVRSGSIYEAETESGVSHFIEHLLFKGTKNRTALQLSEEMDFVGGQMNAYTCRDCTCFHTKTLGENLELSLDILSDMYKNSLFDKSELEQERRVIIEEINMYEDSPEDLVHDLLASELWGQSPYGRSISGTAESVLGLSRPLILDYFSRRYTPENTVLSVAGLLNEDELIALAERYFGDIAPGGGVSVPAAPEIFYGKTAKFKDIEQTHLCLGWEGYPLGDTKNTALTLMNEILGGGMSSRLFQEVREKLGLCYSVYSFSSAYPKAGSFGVYTAMSPENLNAAREVITRELERFMREGASEYELTKTKSQFKCSCLMSYESTSAVMSRLGRGLLVKGSVKTEAEILAEIEAVTREDILSVAREVLSRPHAEALVGP